MSKLIASSAIALLFLIGLAMPLLAQGSCAQEKADVAKMRKALADAIGKKDPPLITAARVDLKEAEAKLTECQQHSTVNPCAKIEISIATLEREKTKLQNSIDAKKHQLDACKADHPK